MQATLDTFAQPTNKEKECNTCHKIKPLECFSKNKNFSDGHGYTCKECNRKYSREYYLLNKEKRSAQGKEHYIKNRETITKRHLKNYYDNFDKISVQRKGYRAANRDKISEQSKEYYRKNKDKINKKHSEYRSENIEKEHMRHKKYRLENIEKIYAYMKEYRKTPNGRQMHHRSILKRKKLGYNPINEYFEGSHYHHLRYDANGNKDNDIGIHIPGRLHNSVFHNGFTGQGMEEIIEASPP
jgi:hypothetical protein